MGAHFLFVSERKGKTFGYENKFFSKGKGDVKISSEKGLFPFEFYCGTDKYPPPFLVSSA